MLKIEPLLLEHAFQKKKSQSQNSMQYFEFSRTFLVPSFLCDFIFWPQNVRIYIHEPSRSQFSLQRKRRPWDFSRWGDHPVSPYFLIGHTKPYLGRRCCCQSWTTKKVCTDFFNGPSKLPNLASVSLIGARGCDNTKIIFSNDNAPPRSTQKQVLFMTLTFFTLPTYWF